MAARVAPARAGTAYQPVPASSTTGTRLARMSRTIPPPTAVIMPSRAAGTTDSPESEALTAPLTQNRARPRVEGQDDVLPAGQDRVPEEGRDAGQRRGQQVAPVGQSGWRHVVDE